MTLTLAHFPTTAGNALALVGYIQFTFAALAATMMGAEGSALAAGLALVPE